MLSRLKRRSAEGKDECLDVFPALAQFLHTSSTIGTKGVSIEASRQTTRLSLACHPLSTSSSSSSLAMSPKRFREECTEDGDGSRGCAQVFARMSNKDDEEEDTHFTLTPIKERHASSTVSSACSSGIASASASSTASSAPSSASSLSSDSELLLDTEPAESPPHQHPYHLRHQRLHRHACLQHPIQALSITPVATASAPKDRATSPALKSAVNTAPPTETPMSTSNAATTNTDADVQASEMACSSGSIAEKGDGAGEGKGMGMLAFLAGSKHGALGGDLGAGDGASSESTRAEQEQELEQDQDQEHSVGSSGSPYNLRPSLRHRRNPAHHRQRRSRSSSSRKDGAVTSLGPSPSPPTLLATRSSSPSPSSSSSSIPAVVVVPRSLSFDEVRCADEANGDEQEGVKAARMDVEVEEGKGTEKCVHSENLMFEAANEIGGVDAEVSTVEDKGRADGQHAYITSMPAHSLGATSDRGSSTADIGSRTSTSPSNITANANAAAVTSALVRSRSRRKSSPSAHHPQPLHCIPTVTIPAPPAASFTAASLISSLIPTTTSFSRGLRDLVTATTPRDLHRAPLAEVSTSSLALPGFSSHFDTSSHFFLIPCSQQQSQLSASLPVHTLGSYSPSQQNSVQLMPVMQYYSHPSAGYYVPMYTSAPTRAPSTAKATTTSAPTSTAAAEAAAATSTTNPCRFISSSISPPCSARSQTATTRASNPTSSSLAPNPLAIVTPWQPPVSSVTTTSTSPPPSTMPPTSSTSTASRSTQPHHEYARGVDLTDPMFAEMADLIKMLPPPVPSTMPALPRKACDPPFTLVLDLDETLVHCSVTAMPNCSLTFPVVVSGMHYTVYVRERPFLREFLHAVSGLFEVVLFTASQRIYADKLASIIDPLGALLPLRLFREHCVVIDGNYIKDLGVLGRSLTHTVIVDNSPHAFAYHTANAIPIVSWYEDPGDRELEKLLGMLQHMLSSSVQDVRPFLRALFALPERQF